MIVGKDYMKTVFVTRRGGTIISNQKLPRKYFILTYY